MRDFEKEPLLHGEIPTYEDIYELYIIRNLSKKEVSKILKRNSIKKYLKIYNITKSKELKNLCRRRTNLEKYGYESVSQHPEIKNKKKETCLKNYGVDNPAKSSKIKNRIKETCVEKYNCSNPMQCEEIKEKFKQTMIKRYGVDNANKLSDFKEKAKKTLFNKYGYENIKDIPQVIEKRKQTNLKRYGSEYLYGSEYFKNKCKETWKNTLGVDNPAKSEQVKKKLRVKVPEMLRKMCNTKRCNKTFNTSKPEKRIYQLLKTKFPLTKTQYRTKEYPHDCDFYVPELDLYIEYHGNWTHGFEPYDCNCIQHQERLKIMQEKAKISKYYKTAVKVWTKDDIQKVEDAKRNNLNLKVFYTEEQFMYWFENIE